MAKINIKNDATPTTPPAGYTSLYAKSSDKQLYFKDDTGTEYAVGTVTSEQIQDAIGGVLTDTASVDLTYNDGSDTITATVLPAGVDHDSLQNFVANEHIDHTSVSISTGTGLSGGGTIAANRTLIIADTGVSAAAYGDGKNVPTITLNAQGQATAASTSPIKPQLDGEISFVEDRTYTIQLNAEHAKTISNLRIKLATGTCTADVQINGVTVTSLGSLSVTTTKQTFTATALNSVIANDTITLVISNSVSASNLSFSLEF